MSEDQVYKDGDIVWVKLGNNWWPGEVIDAHRHPDGMVNNVKRKLYCIVKFFNENAYEYVTNLKQIYPFQCAKKEEFLKKGFSLYKSGNKFMEKFPEDVEVAERLTRHKTPSLFINDRPDSIVKAILGQPLVLTCDDEYRGSSEYREKRRSSESITKIINITPNKPSAMPPTAITSIRIEPVKTTASSSSYGMKSNAHNISISPRTSIGDSSFPKNLNNASNNNNNYRCNLCEFTSVRQNVMILHRKMHNNRNGPPTVPMTNRPNTTPNRNINVNHLDGNTKVTKTPCETTTTPNIKSVITPKIPAKVLSNEDIEFTNSSKKSSSKAIGVTCCSANELNISPAIPNETQSRRSTRHTKTGTAATSVKTMIAPPTNSTLNGPTISIDLPETKPIKKIPKKRDFANLNLQQLEEEYEIPPVAQEVQIPASDVCATPLPATPTVTKGNAEEIRNMLLADWSDEDEAADHDRNEKDKVTVTSEDSDRNINNTEIMQRSPDHVITSSTPSITSKSPNTGRIRNIPKKDRRDVILQDFGGDLSLIEPEKESTNQALVVHLDSSNSSAVEVIEEQQPPIITINDDEEDAKEKAVLDINRKKDTKLSPVRTSDLENVEPNDKSIVASILSCFDFQDDEDEDDIDTPASVTTSIAHFKKKYLSTEKSQCLISNESDISRAAKEKHEERAQKDQELTAEIESLLEQTQPPVADLLTSTNSFEESMSVKDLPIKERGKRIFKSRNRSRIEGKSSTESLNNSISIDDSLTKDVSANAMNNKPAKTQRVSTEIQSQVGDEVDKNKCSKDSPNLSTDGIAIVPLEEQSARDLAERLHNEKAANKENSPEVIIDITSHDNGKNISDITPNENSPEIVIDIHSVGNDKNIYDITPNDELVVYIADEDIKNQDVIKETEMSETLNNTSSVECTEAEHKSFEETPFPDLPLDLPTENNEVSTNQDEIVDKPPPWTNNDISIEEDDLPIHEVSTTDVNLTEETTPIEESILSKVKEHRNLYSEKENESHLETNLNVIEVSNLDVNVKEDKSNVDSILNEGNEDLNLPSDKVNVNNFETNFIVTEAQDVNNDFGEVSKSEEEAEVDKQNSTLQDATLEVAPSVSLKRDKGSCEESEEHVDGVDEKSQSPITTIMPEPEQAPAEELTSNRMINTSPTDENSSMGASDTGAEFGSPASMLSEERLPTFPFNRNETPQQEIEVTENASSEEITKKLTDKQDNDTDNVESNKSPKELVAEESTICENDRIANVEANIINSTTAKEILSSEMREMENEESISEKCSSSVDSKSLTQTESSECEPIQKARNSPIPLSHNRKKRHMKHTPRRSAKEILKDSADCIQSPVNVVGEVATQQMRITDNVSNKSSAELTVLESQEGGVKAPISKDVNNENGLNIQEENCNKVESLNNVLSTSQTSIKSPDNMKKQPEEISNKIPDNVEESMGTTKIITKDSPIQEPEDQLYKIMETTNAVENPQDKLGEIIDTSSEKVSNSTDVNIVECTEKEDTVELVENETKPLQKDDDQTNAKSVENILSEETTSIKHDTNIVIDVPTKDISESLETICETTNSKKNEQTAKDISVEEQPDTDIEDKTNGDQNIKDNNGSIESNTKSKSRIAASKQKKRSGETILLAKRKHRKIHETAAKNVHDPDIFENIETTDNENVEHSTPKSNQIDIDNSNKSDSNVESNEAVPKSTVKNIPNMSTKSEFESTLPSTENNSATRVGPDLAISLSPGIPPTTPQEKEIVIDECESPSFTPQQKDLIIECETIEQTTTQVIDFDNMSVSPTPQKKDIVGESKTITSLDNVTTVEDEYITISSTEKANQITEDASVDAEITAIDKNVIVGENTSTLTRLTDTQEDRMITERIKSIDREKDITTISQPVVTDADKATHEFLIEFDNLVNQSKKENEEVINAEDIINNIIVEVQEDNRKQTEISETNLPATTSATDFGHTDETTTSQKPFYRQTIPIKRRQTLCFDLSESSASRKRQIFDFEDVLPSTLTAHKRTAERKMTLPDTETTNSMTTSPLDFDKQFMAFRPRRRSSIEDNIASFLIQRPNAERLNEDVFPELLESNSSTSSTGRKTYKQLSIDSRGNKIVVIKNPPSQETSKIETKAANGRNTKRKGRRASMHVDHSPQSKIPRDASGCVPKIPKTELIVSTLNDNQISTAQQQLLQLQQQQPQTQSSSIILNKSTSRTRKTHKTSPAVHNPQQQQNSNQLVVQQMPVQQLQQQQLQQQLITQLSGQQNVLQFAVTQPVPQQQQHIQQVQQTNEGFIITTATPTEDDNVIDSNTQLIALPTQPYPGYTETFLLCKVNGNTCKPVDNVPLYLNHQLNELVPIPSDVLERGPKISINESSIDIKENNTQQLIGQNKASGHQIHVSESEITDESEGQTLTVDTEGIVHQEFLEDNMDAGAEEGEGTVDLSTNNGILLNIEGQQVLLDAATFAHLLANPDTNTQLISDDGTEYVLTHEVLQALHMQQQQQQQQQVVEIANADVNNDLIAVAMAGSDLYGNGVLTIDTSQAVQLIDGSGSLVFQQPTAPTMVQQHLTPPAVVTNAVLDQSPIMSTLEVPSSNRMQVPHCISVPSLPIVTPSSVILGGNARTNLDDSLAAIGVTAQTSAISSSLGLPITVTDPNIASKVTSAGPLNEILQFVSHRPGTAQATAAAVAAAALAGESRIFND